MSILYNTVSKPNPQSKESPNKWYVIPKSIAQIKEETLYKKIGEKLNMTSGTVRSVFEASQDIIIEYLANSYTVKISSLGNFSVNFQSYGAISKEEAKANMVAKKYVNINPCPEIQDAINAASLVAAESLKGGTDAKVAEVSEITDPEMLITTGSNLE